MKDVWEGDGSIDWSSIPSIEQLKPQRKREDNSGIWEWKLRKSDKNCDAYFGLRLWEIEGDQWHQPYRIDDSQHLNFFT